MTIQYVGDPDSSHWLDLLSQKLAQKLQGIEEDLSVSVLSRSLLQMEHPNSPDDDMTRIVLDFIGLDGTERTAKGHDIAIAAIDIYYHKKTGMVTILVKWDPTSYGGPYRERNAEGQFELPLTMRTAHAIHGSCASLLETDGKNMSDQIQKFVLSACTSFYQEDVKEPSP